MANQYTKSFKSKLESYYRRDIMDVILLFQEKGYTYNDVCDLHGFNIDTVYKNCSRLSMSLRKKHRYEPSIEVVRQRIVYEFGISLEKIKTSLESKSLTYAQITSVTGFNPSLIQKSLF